MTQKSNNQKAAEENNRVASTNYQKQQVEQIKIALDAEKDKLSRVKAQLEVLKELDEDQFEKTNPEFKYETHPEFIKIMKTFVIGGGEKEVREAEHKIKNLENGLVRETARLRLIESGVNVGTIGDADLEKQIQKGV